MAKRIFFVAGEASGDQHGAAVMRALRAADADLEFHGRGGPQMRAVAGATMRDWVHEAAVVGLWEVLRRYGYFRAEFRGVLGEIALVRPDAVVLIDYPGFNLRLARVLRASGTSAKIIYYISPQVWAWNRRRIPRMAKWLDLMLCIFPFEAELYNASGLRTIFVGHPIAENLNTREMPERRERDLVGLFPGSRMREVRSIFPVIQEAATAMRAELPQLRFEIAAASGKIAAEVARMLSPLEFAKFSITVGEAPNLMRRAMVGLVASGTATLESACFRLPFVLVYKVSWLTYLAARLVVRVEHLGMPNVLAGREIVREFIQHEARPDQIAKAALALLQDPAARADLVREFDNIVAKLGESRASKSAASAILEEIGASDS